MHKILLVDDTPANLKVLMSALNSRGCETLTATSGERALSVVGVNRPELILLDINMPGMDGYETCRRLKANPNTADIPVIFLSALDDMESKLKAFNVGGVDYVSKPFQQEEVWARVGTHLRLYALGKELETRNQTLEAMYEEVVKSRAELENANQKLIESERLLERKVEARTRELLHAKTHAEQLNSAKSDFIAKMNHELRTPLNAILGYAKLMFDDPALPAKFKKPLGVVNRSGEHLLELINTILDLSKIEAGRTEIQTAEFDLHASLKLLYDMFRLQCESKGLTLSLQIDENTPVRVVGDEGKLRQCLINLAGNAVKFTRRGGVAIRSHRSENGTVCFCVSDTGNGIPQEKMAAIFEPFTQIHDRLTNKGGTGLGLTLTRSFVELMGGKLSVESEVGVGSRFTFALPLPERPGGQAEEPSNSSRKIVRILNDVKPKILVADADPDACALIRDLMRPLGFVVYEGRDAIHAANVVRANPPDLILLDPYRFGSLPPDFDPYFTEMRIITVSSDDGARIRKPFDPQALLAAVGQTLNLNFEYQSVKAENSDIHVPWETVYRLLGNDFWAEYENCLLDGRLDDLAKAVRAYSQPEIAEFVRFVILKIEEYDFDGLEKILSPALSIVQC